MYWLKVIIGLIAFYLIMVLLLGTIGDYRPPNEEDLTADQKSNITAIQDSTLSFMIWNVGYGGLGQESDFFYDSGNTLTSGGKMVRAPEAIVEKNLKGIEQTIKSNAVDFFLLQEVDYNSKRSYYHNQYKGLSFLYPRYSATFSPNYNVNYVPIPILQPWQAYGKVYSGLASFSKYRPTENKRLQLPGSFSWPTRIFQLDRCLLIQRFPTQNGKELIVLNVHNSAYDSQGELKTQQMDFIKNLILEEYQKNGNYIVVGGDWNQCPPNFPFDTFAKNGDTAGYSQINIDAKFYPKGWYWAYDKTLPSNRKIQTPYNGDSFTTIIDFFLVSPNIEVNKVRNVHTNFKYSDHEPIKLDITLLDF